ncbi:hypothetical protein ACEYYH_09640 [Microbacterium trichothecenolyticum]|jgi:hypothetical protein|uniref:hypothetical protein n=1 Tax=Microbacterium trichothecenolyticum TaxID=69370 RepID=UPI0035BE581E
MHQVIGSISARSSEGLQFAPADPDMRVATLAHLLSLLDQLPDFDGARSADEAALFDADDVVSHGEAFILIVPLIEACLESVDLAPALAAQLAFLSMFPSVPETIAMQVGFGRSIGEEQIRDIARLFSRAARRGVTVDDYVAELDVAGELPRGKLVRLFHGETRRIPDPDRMTRGVALLRSVLALVPDTARPPLLCAIAWLQWARGKRAVAMAYVAEAQRIDATHILAYGLSWLITTKTPRWTMSSPSRDDGQTGNV